MRSAGKMILVAVAVLAVVTSCKNGPTPSHRDPLEGGAVADLASSMVPVANEVYEDGADPHAPKTKFLRDGVVALEQLTGPGDVLPPTDETIRDLKLAIQKEKTGRADEREAARKAKEDEREAARKAKEEQDKEIAELKSERGRLAWIVLGISCAVALAGVIVLWIKTTWKVGLFAVGGWSLAYTAISLGMFYEQHRTAVIAGVILLAGAVVGIIVLARVFRKEVASWQAEAAESGTIADVLIESVEQAKGKGVKKAVKAKASTAGVGGALDAKLGDKGYLGKSGKET